MKVISDSWNRSGPSFGEVISSDLDYRVFLQDEIWPLSGIYQDLTTLTRQEVFTALEGLFCAAERHYKGMIQWYEDQYHQILSNNSVSGALFLGFLVDYQTLMTKTPHQWLRDSILGRTMDERLEQIRDN